MATSADAVLAFFLAAAIAWLLVPLAERLALRVGAIDQPKERGLHDKPMPRLSGLAILVAVEVAGWIWLPADGETRAILLGAVAIAAVGVADDIWELPAPLKLAGQVAAATIPVLAGVRVDVLTLPFVGGFELGWTAYPLTVLGIVAVVNVINFLDGVDGLAAGVCTIAAIALAVIALSLDRNAAGVLAALTAGGALGFLRHGFPPATSFMGDTGSNLLGYLLAAVAIQGALKTNAVVALAFPLVVLAVPILDTGFGVAKRLKYRRPIFAADTWHFHHRMANIGYSQRRTIAYLYAWTAAMASLALALRFVPYSNNRGDFDAGWTAVMIVFLLLALLASIRLLYALEILKLRRFRYRQVDALTPGHPDQEVIDAGVARELETGSFAAIDPETGEFAAIDPETGEFDAIKPGGS
ncbi:MAG TPA: MraY family glycosyltransferase [Solirubrobacterales bacterium]|nr:MraY family glycosyltransferase [Solirubrobacterales bacterium]